MPVRVDLFVIWLPKIGHYSNTLSKPYIAQFTDCQVECILVATDSCQEHTPLLVQVVLWKQLKYLVRNVEVALLQESLHSTLKDLDSVTRFNFCQIQLRCLIVTEPLELLLGVFDVQTAKLGMRDLPLFKLGCSHVLQGGWLVVICASTRVTAVGTTA